MFEQVITSPSDTDIVGRVSQYDNTALVYGIDWNRANGASTLAFKSGDGLAATVNSKRYAAALESRNGHFRGTVHSGLLHLKRKPPPS